MPFNRTIKTLSTLEVINYIEPLINICFLSLILPVELILRPNLLVAKTL